MFRIYKNNIIRALEALSSYEYQKAAWFENNQGLSYSYNENALDLFYDSSLDKALKSGEIVFGIVVDAILSELESMVDKINANNYKAEELINSPEMRIIREKATLALESVKSSDGSESTVEIIE